MRSLVPLVGVLIALSACKTPPVWINPHYAKNPLPNGARVVILPIYAQGFADKLDAEVEAALVKGVQESSLGQRGVLLQSLKTGEALYRAGLANVPWQLAEGAHFRVTKFKDASFTGKNPAKTPNKGAEWIDPLAAEVDRFLRWAQGKPLASGQPLGFQPRWVVSIYVQALEEVIPKGQAKKMKQGEPPEVHWRFRLIGALYDAERKRVVALYHETKTTKHDKAAYLAVVGGFGARLAGHFGQVLR